MINLDNTLLQELSLSGLPADQQRQALEYFQEMLETRVGTRLTSTMTDAQLTEFEDLINNKNNEDGATEWLQLNFPNYPQLVNEELEKLKAEVKGSNSQSSSQIPQNNNQLENLDLFKQIGLGKLPDKEKLALSGDLGEVVMSRVATRLEAILTAEQAKAFDATLKTDDVKAFALLEEFVPDYNSIINEEIEYLRSEVIDTQSEVMKRLEPLDQ